jgi:hypothetical protein
MIPFQTWASKPLTVFEGFLPLAEDETQELIPAYLVSSLAQLYHHASASYPGAIMNMYPMYRELY